MTSIRKLLKKDKGWRKRYEAKRKARTAAAAAAASSTAPPPQAQTGTPPITAAPDICPDNPVSKLAVHLKENDQPADSVWVLLVSNLTEDLLFEPTIM